METNNSNHQANNSTPSDKPKRKPPQTPEEIAVFKKIMEAVKSAREKREAEILKELELED